MEFRRLENSIKLNQTEEPSIYMALCMVESLFKDIKDNTGKDISEIPAGDEMLPVKLVWMYRMVDNIYLKKSDTFTRSLEDLKKKREHLLEEKEQLEQAAKQVTNEKNQYLEVQEQLTKCRDRYEELERELKEAQGNYKEWQELVKLCECQSRELQELNHISELEQQIKSRNQEYQCLVNHRTEKEAALRDAESLLAALKPIASQESIQQINQAKNRCKSLETVRSELERSVEEMQDALGMERIQGLQASLPASLKRVQSCLDQVNQQLLNCAKECEKELQWEAEQ